VHEANPVRSPGDRSHVDDWSSLVRAARRVHLVLFETINPVTDWQKSTSWSSPHIEIA